MILDAVKPIETSDVTQEIQCFIDLDQFSLVYFDIELQRLLDKLIIIASDYHRTITESDGGKSFIQQLSQNIRAFDLETSEIEKIIEVSNHLLQRKMNSLFCVLSHIAMHSQNINVSHTVQWIFENKFQPIIKASSTFYHLSDDLNEWIDFIEKYNAYYVRNLRFWM